MSELETNLLKIRNNIDLTKEELKKLFYIESKKFFQKYNYLKSYGWTQYTPYWNDGDVCKFSVYTDLGSIYINNESYYNIEDDGKLQTYKEIALDIIEFLCLFDNDEFQYIFGDHCKITIYPSKIQIDSYTHD